MLPQTRTSLKDAKLSRYFKILKIVLFCMPFLCVGYLGLGAGGAALDTAGILNANPAMAVSFLAAMLQPYAAWIAILAERRLADGRTNYAIMNLALLMSTVGVIGMALILWKSVRTYGCGIPAAFLGCGVRDFFREAGGNLPLLALAALCLFASMRLGIGVSF
mgnify:CR=1 FL=1